MKIRAKLSNDINGLTALAALALIPLIGVGGVVAVWAYEQYSGTALFSLETGTDIENYLWLAAFAIIGIVTLVLLLRPRR